MRQHTEGNRASGTIELQLPLKSEYLPILRATTGVVAGVILLNYEEIKDLRMAVSEIFNLGIKHIAPGGGASEVNEMTVRFSLHPDKLEILIMGQKDYTSYLNTEEGTESLALLNSLVDGVEFSAEAAGKSLIRMVKFR